MRRLLLLALGLVLGITWTPAWLWAAAAQISDSRGNVDTGPSYVYRQLVRCDNSASIAGTSDSGGETCESGDWSLPLDCRGAKDVTLYFYEYGAGSGEAKLWDCIQSTGFDTFAAAEDPTAAPSAADPDPLCVDVTAGAGVTVIGTTAGVQRVTFENLNPAYLVGEIQDCTGNCDSTLAVSCRR